MIPAEAMPNRLAIWIDVEGFKHLHAKHMPQALTILGRLAEDIYLVASQMYPENPNCLYIHHAGDGFLIVTDISDRTPERFVAIAIALLRSLLSFGGLARAGVSFGDFADIFMCYPKSIQEAYDNATRGLPVGNGSMSIMRVMGGALINAHSTARDGQSGPSLRIDSRLKDQIENIEGLVIIDETDQTLAIDWFRSNIPLADQIVRTIRGQIYNTELLSTRLREYIKRFEDTLSDNWKVVANQLLELKYKTNHPLGNS